MTTDTTGHSSATQWIVHERFFELYDRLLGHVELSDVLEHLAKVVSDVTQAEGTTVYLVRDETHELEATALIHNVRRQIRIPVSTTSLAGFCAHSGRAFVIPDAYGDLSPVDPGLHFDSSWDKAHDYRTRDVMCAPATFKGNTVGVVQVLNSRQGTFEQADLDALRSVARLVGYALHHARLYDDLASMKQLQKEKAKFMGVMVHELKAPLAAARMMADTLRMGIVPEEKKDGFLDRIGQRLDSMLGMTTDTLMLSRAASGDLLGKVEVVDLAEEVRTHSEAYREQALGKDLAFEFALPDTPLSVRIDTQGLKLIVSNLVSNAVKYTPDGWVRVRVERSGEHAVFSVSDSGMGIPAEDVPKLFGEFFRAANAKGSDIEGTGVGLAGVKSIVERFGGELRLQTEENEGSTFSVHLPLFTGKPRTTDARE